MTTGSAKLLSVRNLLFSALLVSRFPFAASLRKCTVFLGIYCQRRYELLSIPIKFVEISQWWIPDGTLKMGRTFQMVVEQARSSPLDAEK